MDKEPVAQASIPPKKSSTLAVIFKYFAIGTGIAGIGILVAVGGFLLGQRNDVTQKQILTATPTVTVSNSSTSSEPTAPAPTSAVDEKAMLIMAIKNALIAEHGSQAASLNVTVSKIEGNSAQGAASEPVGGGGMWFAARSDKGIWTLVWDGNGIIPCSILGPYPNLPSDMIPECFDDKTQTLIKR